MPDPAHPQPPLPTWPLADHPDAAAEALRSALVAAYGGADRDYHDLRHLAEVLERLDELAEHGVAFDALSVRLAAWFHDSVYDGERDAEERSATWAEQALPDLVGDEVTAEVARLVRMTETHQPEDDDPGACALSDADLSILAAPAPRYATYVASVRREYAHVADDDFALGRAAVLDELAAKDRLFHTDYAARSWEARARANMSEELARLAPRVDALTG